MRSLGLDISIRKGLAFAFFDERGQCTLHGVWRGDPETFFDQEECGRLSLVVWEEPYHGKNSETFKQLVKLSAKLERICEERELKYETVHPMHWKPVMSKNTTGPVQRAMLTAIANGITRTHRTLTLKDDDEVDAICLGFYGRRYLHGNGNVG